MRIITIAKQIRIIIIAKQINIFSKLQHFFFSHLAQWAQIGPPLLKEVKVPDGGNHYSSSFNNGGRDVAGTTMITVLPLSCQSKI
jgi:hypothetical protein